ncbi:MAG TPA: aldehyde dehydrogenase family protein [Allosphingosinicella sp.]|nr:aldehyde dehydrogenase family protein [Allosphingosinicella sp.]
MALFVGLDVSVQETSMCVVDDAGPVVLGADTAFAEYFCTLPWDHLCFTGGTAIGRRVAALAAPQLTPLTLELGGKNPTVFSDSGVSPGLVERFLYNRVFKGGQVCTSPDYALVPEDRLDDWVALARETWTAMYPAYVGHPDATGTINRRHYDRILGYLAEAEAAGCAVISLNGEGPDPERLQLPMVIVVDPPETLGVMTDEIFGPVTAVKPYRDFDEAVAYCNGRARPLAAYFVGREPDLAETFQARVIAGGIGINVFGLQGAEPGLPFGGIGASGMGCHSGLEGFLNFTHAKSVFECADDSPLMAALKGPYGAMTQAFADAVFPAAD